MLHEIFSKYIFLPPPPSLSKGSEQGVKVTAMFLLVIMFDLKPRGRIKIVQMYLHMSRPKRTFMPNIRILKSI